MLTNVLFFREKITWWKLLSLVLGFGGVLTFVGASRDSDMIGVVLALGSVASYAFLMIGIERTAIKDMPAVRMSIYSHTTSLIGSFIIGTATGQLNFKLTPGAWVSSVAVALMVAVGAFTLLNYAIIKCGASTTAIIAMLEPLTGVLFGWLILKESLSPINLLGFLLIMSGVVLVSWYSGRKIPLEGDQEEGNGCKELQ
jgi:drug/metabolite transporter (DMT)-like permease